MPRAEFWAMKQAYVAKYGYTITIPSLDQIIQLSPIDPPTPMEELIWKRKAWQLMSPARRMEIQQYKDKRKAQFLAMLGAPTPKFLLQTGAVMTSLDDMEDCLATLVVIGKVLLKAMPGLVGKILAGPFSWILLATDVINTCVALGRGAIVKIAYKIIKGQKIVEALYGGSKLSRSGKIKALAAAEGSPTLKKMLAAEAKKLKGHIGLTAAAVEAAQVTQNVFGIGISLGPIVGLATDAASGLVRTIMGQQVGVRAMSQPPPEVFFTTGAKGGAEFAYAPPATPPTYYPSCRALKAATVLMAAGHEFDEQTTNMIAATTYLAHQAILSTDEPWNPLDQMVDMKVLQIPAPQGMNWATKEMLEEHNFDWQNSLCWPHNGKPYGAIQDIVTDYPSQINSWMTKEIKKRKRDGSGYFLGALTSEIYGHALANLEGEDQVRYEYTEPARWMNTLLEKGYYPNPDQPKENLTRLAKVLEDNEKNNIHYTQQEFFELMGMLGIELIEAEE